MQIDTKKEGTTLILTPDGRIDSATSEAFLKAAEKLIGEDYETLRFDFSKVDYISSKGLRVLLVLYKQLSGKEVEITGANISVREVFRVTGLEKEFNVK